MNFDQPVVGVGTSDFRVYSSTDDGTSYTRFGGRVTIAIDNDTTSFDESTAGFSQYQITATLPDTGFESDHHLNLRFSGLRFTLDILGSRAPDETDPSRMTRERFAGFADNLITEMPDYRYNTDTSRPTIRTISRIRGASERQTSLGTVEWMVTFTESVEGVGVDDFRYMVSDNSLSATAITSVSGSGTTYTSHGRFILSHEHTAG